MTKANFITRWASIKDIPAIKKLMQIAIEELQKGHLNPAQIAASKELMGLDTTLIEDGTYLLVHCDGVLVGCGGWSDRKTLFGGNHTVGRDAEKLDPQKDPARIRAMYTHPQWARRGIGKLIIETCEQEAKKNHFTQTELMATMAGRPLYEYCGYEPIEFLNIKTKLEVDVPMVRMKKTLKN